MAERKTVYTDVVYQVVVDEDSIGQKPIVAVAKSYEKLMETVDKYIEQGSVLVSLTHKICDGSRLKNRYARGDVYSKFDMVLVHPQ
jgi:hypothetical protein